MDAYDRFIAAAELGFVLCFLIACMLDDSKFAWKGQSLIFKAMVCKCGMWVLLLLSAYAMRAFTG